MPDRVPDNQISVHANSASKTSRYRPEIDGLRAFAVVAVIVNHFNKDILPGGYLGVDIFFVISGYVITSSLFGRPSKDFKDFISGFYERRVKRLVPALSVFVLITGIAICLFNPSPEISLRTGLTSLFGLSNLFLLRRSIDYFAQSTELNVFTHTWSLGVEEQFYILFPFLIWFSGFGRQTKNGARNLFLAVGSLTIASLVGFLYLYPTNQLAAYFLMPSRFWEMAAGCLIFIGFQKRASIEQVLEKVPPLLVMALIVGVMYLPMSMASASTVAVVALSSILIASLKKQTAAFKVFTNPKVVYIGLISYSLYLWHWGVLSISHWTIGIHWWSVPFQVALMLGLAVASYRWIETPLRKGNWFGKRWKTLIVGGGVLAIASGGLIAIDKAKAVLWAGSEIFIKYQQMPYKHCHIFSGTSATFQDAENCGKSNLKSSPTIYVVGDSHGQQFASPIAGFAEKNNLNYKIIWGSSCLFPAAVVRGSKKDTTCYERQREVEKYLLSTVSPGDIIFIGNALYARFNSAWSENEVYSSLDGQNLSINDAADAFSRKFLDLSDELVEMGAKVILFVDGVQFKGLNVPGLMCSSQWFSVSKAFPKECFSSMTEHLDQINRNFEWRKTWQNDNSKLVLNAYNYAMNCTGDQCRADFYSDSNHFLPFYSQIVFDNFIADNPALLNGITTDKN